MHPAVIYWCTRSPPAAGSATRTAFRGPQAYSLFCFGLYKTFGERENRVEGGLLAITPVGYLLIYVTTLSLCFCENVLRYFLACTGAACFILSLLLL